MTETARHNDQNPTDPHQAIALLFLAVAASRLTLDQAQALTAMGVIAELALYALRLLRGRR